MNSATPQPEDLYWEKENKPKGRPSDGPKIVIKDVSGTRYRNNR